MNNCYNQFMKRKVLLWLSFRGCSPSLVGTVRQHIVAEDKKSRKLRKLNEETGVVQPLSGICSQ
jgi:hypothetical protein